MKAVKQFCIASCMTVALAGSAMAGGMCEGFKVTLKNNSSDDLLIKSIHLNGAKFNPNSIDTLKKGEEQTVTVQNAQDDKTMTGKIVLNTLSLPSKRVQLQFDLDDKKAFCEHSDKDSGGDLDVKNTRQIGSVTYNIG